MSPIKEKIYFALKNQITQDNCIRRDTSGEEVNSFNHSEEFGLRLILGYLALLIFGSPNTRKFRKYYRFSDLF